MLMFFHHRKIYLNHIELSHLLLTEFAYFQRESRLIIPIENVQYLKVLKIFVTLTDTFSILDKTEIGSVIKHNLFYFSVCTASSRFLGVFHILMTFEHGNSYWLD